MKNMLGDEVDPEDFKLSFSWTDSTMWVNRGKRYTNDRGVKNCIKYECHVSPNGWTGNTRTIIYELNEPIIHNLRSDISFGEIKQILTEWEKGNPKTKK